MGNMSPPVRFGSSYSEAVNLHNTLGMNRDPNVVSSKADQEFSQFDKKMQRATDLRRQQLEEAFNQRHQTINENPYEELADSTIEDFDESIGIKRKD